MEEYSRMCEMFGHEWHGPGYHGVHFCVHCGIPKLPTISVRQAYTLGFSRREDGFLHADWTRFITLEKKT